jgi:hypothetical protein
LYRQQKIATPVSWRRAGACGPVPGSGAGPSGRLLPIDRAPGSRPQAPRAALAPEGNHRRDHEAAGGEFGAELTPVAGSTPRRRGSGQASRGLRLREPDFQVLQDAVRGRLRGGGAGNGRLPMIRQAGFPSSQVTEKTPVCASGLKRANDSALGGGGPQVEELGSAPQARPLTAPHRARLPVEAAQAPRTEEPGLALPLRHEAEGPAPFVRNGSRRGPGACGACSGPRMGQEPAGAGGKRRQTRSGALRIGLR